MIRIIFALIFICFGTLGVAQETPSLLEQEAVPMDIPPSYQGAFMK